MKILVTGARGFVGRNLIAELQNRGYSDIYQYDVDSVPDALNVYTKDCNFVFHLAGVNRPLTEDEFDKGNRELTSILATVLEKNKNYCPVIYASSIQVEKGNPYGLSKKAGEEVLLAHAENTGAKIIIYRLPNLFGKWCRPNYNSVVATFCYNIAHDLEIKINDSNYEITLCYIDDVVKEFIQVMEGYEQKNEVFCSVEPVYPLKLGELARKIYDFRNSRKSLVMPSLADDLDKKLYATYISYLPEQEFSYDLSKKEEIMDR